MVWLTFVFFLVETTMINQFGKNCYSTIFVFYNAILVTDGCMYCSVADWGWKTLAKPGFRLEERSNIHIQIKARASF